MKIGLTQGSRKMTMTPQVRDAVAAADDCLAQIHNAVHQTAEEVYESVCIASVDNSAIPADADIQPLGAANRQKESSAASANSCHAMQIEGNSQLINDANAIT
jgi:hypothetical protein